MSEWLLGAQLKARSVVCIRQAFFACCLVVQLCPTLCTPWTAARQAPLSIGFPRQEYWSELPFLSPGDLPDPGVKPESPALAGDSLPLSHQESPIVEILVLQSLTKNHIDFTQQFYFASQEF